ncbi:MAG: hypothetical protein E4H01_05170, partial [Lysobacterales bacterium]
MLSVRDGERGLLRLAPYAALLAVSLTAACLQMRLGDSEAGLVLEDLVTGDSRLRKAAPEPVVRSLRFGSTGEGLRGDLYLPVLGVRAAMVLVPGLAAAGNNDPRLVALARTLARVGFLVLIPEIPGFRAYRVSIEDVE